MDQVVDHRYSASFFSGRKVFVTGHTGFKGSWLTFLLSKAGAKLKGYSLAPDTDPSLYQEIEGDLVIDSVYADINHQVKLENEILAFQPDFIFHLAAQSLVRRSYQDPLATFGTNIFGTANILNALRKLNKKCVTVIITTDKVYENKELEYRYRETDGLGGYDPYSASKACAELVTASYRQSFFNPALFHAHKKSVVSVRAGNVIGGGDWSADRLIPDIIRSLIEAKAIVIRNPAAVRPWQHVLEPISGYLELASRVYLNPFTYDGAWNFGPAANDTQRVEETAAAAVKVWGEGNLEVKQNPSDPHEAGILMLDITKAQNELNWQPRMSTAMAINRTINWYKSFYNKTASAATLMESDILYYAHLIDN